ncbi:hypothetical protein KSS93_17995 [Pseudomonas xanthosomatis]|uniref:hypothetical protein n=1 Tax=Pseudomonas xanthosomatis TaxID=2842356 RepID=UPI001C3D1ABA|nr:hypothetical protein [Pseudomonas xanthosomatis]QXH44771.1 hypothetical protein KSS93_17995 [Pseudomonas xanthosomatis]
MTIDTGQPLTQVALQASVGLSSGFFACLGALGFGLFNIWVDGDLVRIVLHCAPVSSFLLER